MRRVALRIAVPVGAVLMVCGFLTVASVSTQPATTVEIDKPVVTYMREATSKPRLSCPPASSVDLMKLPATEAANP